MRFLFLFLLFGVSFADECGISSPVEEQTTEGIAPLGKWPWQVYMKHSDDGFCGGSIVADRWILSAAHCFDDNLETDPEDNLIVEGKYDHVLIRTGVVNIEEAALDDFQHKNVYQVKKVYVHKYYNSTTFEDDIALLELERPITFSSTVAPICLASADQDVNIDQEAWLIGFGTYIDDDTKDLVHDVSNVLREAMIPLARHSKCENEWKDEATLDRIICAGAQGIGAGKGDSGGPLMVQSADGPWYQVGIVSFGRDDDDIATDHTIGGYTSVGHYCEWISKVTGGAAKCSEKEVEVKLLKEEHRVDDTTEATDEDDEEEKKTEGSDTAEKFNEDDENNESDDEDSDED